MPLYEYRCRTCDHQFEIQQSITEDSLTVCPECKGSLRKVFAPVGIAFKGSGFYKNDSRSGSGSSSASTNGSGSSGGSDSSAGSDSSTSSSDGSDSSGGSGSSGSSDTKSASGSSSGSSEKKTTPAAASAD